MTDETVVSPPPFAVGDGVMWKGVGPLAITQIFDDGSIEAMSLTLRVHTSDMTQLEKVQ